MHGPIQHEQVDKDQHGRRRSPSPGLVCDLHAKAVSPLALGVLKKEEDNLQVHQIPSKVSNTPHSDRQDVFTDVCGCSWVLSFILLPATIQPGYPYRMVVVLCVVLLMSVVLARLTVLSINSCSHGTK